MSSSIEILGLCATALSCVAAIPQIHRIIKTANAEAISVHTHVILLCANIFWTIYACSIGTVPLLGCSLFMISTSLTILVLKRRYKNEAAPAAVPEGTIQPVITWIPYTHLTPGQRPSIPLSPTLH